MTDNKFDSTGPVVVGVDGSVSSEAALRWAGAVAATSGRELRVVLVESHPEPQYMVAPEPVWPWPVLRHANPEQISRALKLLNSVVSHTLGDSQRFEASVLTGDPAGELLAEVEQRGASLLVLGRRGRGGFTSLLLGSVGDQCAGRATCPVAVISHDVTGARGPVLVGVDDSEESAVAARWAADYALTQGDSLHLVTCWHIAPESWAQRVVEEARTQLRDYAPELNVEASAIQGQAGQVIPEMAAEGRFGLVVVGSRGHGGFTRLLLGSVAHNVLHHATTPVAVVPHE